MTPSQQAKDFAAANGFVIKPVERRYHVMRAGMPLTFVADVGGYPAALNAMKAWIDAQASDAATFDNPADARAKVYGLVRIGGERDDELNARIDAFLAPATASGAHLDELAKILPRTRDEVTAPKFDDFNSESQARIRRAARHLTKRIRKASGKPPGGPWHVIFDESTVMKYGYPTRADALAVVRWGFNHPESSIRNNWRTKCVTVEYRPS